MAVSANRLELLQIADAEVRAAKVATGFALRARDHHNTASWKRN